MVLACTEYANDPANATMTLSRLTFAAKPRLQIRGEDHLRMWNKDWLSPDKALMRLRQLLASGCCVRLGCALALAARLNQAGLDQNIALPFITTPR